MQVMDSATAKRAVSTRIKRNRIPGRGHPTTADMEYTSREEEFMFAMQEFKRKSGRPFPTWSEALRVIDSLGYVQEMRPKPHVAVEAA